MYVTLNGKVLSQDEIDKYNSNKTAYQIFPQLLWRVQTVVDFLNVDQDLKEYDDLSRHMEGIGWEVRKRVSKDGCSLLYCFVNDGLHPQNLTPPLPHKEIDAIDFKFFKEEDVIDPPAEMLESDDDSTDENAWHNRLIRCKVITNCDDKVIDEFKEFVAKVEGLEVEYNKPYLKATFESQDAKDRTFELMADDFEWDGDNVNYFRRILEWSNITLRTYEAHTSVGKWV